MPEHAGRPDAGKELALLGKIQAPGKLRGMIGMRTAIVYGSKTGTTKHCAEMIHSHLPQGSAKIFDVRSVDKAALVPFAAVVIGTPIYMSRLNKGIAKLLTEQQEVLLGKELHFFICGLAQGDDGIELFRKQVTPELLSHARQVAQLGGEVHPERLNFFYRFIIKKVMAKENLQPQLLPAAIKNFAQGIANGRE